MTVLPVPIVFIIVQKLFDAMAIRYTKVWKNGVSWRNFA